MFLAGTSNSVPVIYTGTGITFRLRNFIRNYFQKSGPIPAMRDAKVKSDADSQQLPIWSCGEWPVGWLKSILGLI